MPEGEQLAELILDFDPQTKEALVKVDPVIVAKLKPHQAKGILFMWQACFESVEQFRKPGNCGSGCILAHCMGLGKTLQVRKLLCSMFSKIRKITNKRVHHSFLIC